ncbi:hypothetical protein BU14_0057s0010 [Porphyra umbilicalis]|uniref:Uncharacterized protein n=1 Tax=Porphyra umbilicalis TaxID=2786 RepID=A0A1X6PH28_PORUM|nr:hypothetical protein BU14_0057s0010 [Porphyra umbilicalis]|eukprot:OSX80189.1 hypothetical protein BU14_0057s0010 [Porphyra umbilicalis]
MGAGGGGGASCRRRRVWRRPRRSSPVGGSGGGFSRRPAAPAAAPTGRRPWPRAGRRRSVWHGRRPWRRRRRGGGGTDGKRTRVLRDGGLVASTVHAAAPSRPPHGRPGRRAATCACRCGRRNAPPRAARTLPAGCHAPPAGRLRRGAAGTDAAGGPHPRTQGAAAGTGCHQLANRWHPVPPARSGRRVTGTPFACRDAARTGRTCT